MKWYFLGFIVLSMTMILTTMFMLLKYQEVIKSSEQSYPITKIESTGKGKVSCVCVPPAAFRGIK